ncbi:VOC family protein [Petropleomorpha daqingensis]|uniref:Glyoxalase-like domain-containing protein n=1 Tax=Petropleomorpha daqingensis TaxID=2026353 RepID=A0A853CJ57_9ACTN|nr:VOC family protein [Petropleomorpha daqingensis]NYJ06003.1 hypothetical protein [Petropleomorpha daqingensis]
MATDFQVVVDCAAPHELADWWAEALGWQVEAQDAAFIRRMIDAGYATDDETTTHNGALVWKTGAAINSPDPNRPRVLFQWVPEGKTVKNRVHLDLRVGAERREAEVARLVAAGAKELHRASQGPHEWATLADPEGNEFCVA